MMRIITGKAKGVRLDTLEGEETRPTPERVKEAVFSMLQFEIEGRRILDLFSGSGQMGLEALSRGAKSATLIDQNPAAIAIIKKNAQKTKLFSQCRILCSDAFLFLKSIEKKEKFDGIFLDPPYAKKLIPSLLNKIASAELLTENAFVICETEEETPPSSFPCFHLQKHIRYGRVYISLFYYQKEAIS